MARDDDIFGPSRRKQRRKRSIKNHGKLHELLTEALPDFRHRYSDACDPKQLAEALDLTVATIYNWLKSGTLPANQAKRIIDLAKKQNDKGKAKALTMRDFEDFLTA